MIWPAPGIYPNISPDDYFGLKEIDGKLVRSNSMLHDFDRDPAEFNAGRVKNVTNAMRRGSIFDCLITQQHRFESQFVISPHDKFQSNAAKAWRDEQVKTIVKPIEFEEAEKCVHAVKSDPRWKEITEGNCLYQVGLRADIGGHHFKALVDVLPDADGPFGDAIVDVKRQGQMESIADILRACRNQNLNRQGGLYRGIARALKMKRNRYLLYIVQQSGPVAPCVLELSTNMLDTGAQTLMQINNRLIECEQTGIWPSRFDGIKQVDQGDESWAWSEVQDDLAATHQTETQP